jgi:hypothetical protein
MSISGTKAHLLSKKLAHEEEDLPCRLVGKCHSSHYKGVIVILIAGRVIVEEVWTRREAWVKGKIKGRLLEAGIRSYVFVRKDSCFLSYIVCVIIFLVLCHLSEMMSFSGRHLKKMTSKKSKT